MNEFKEGYKVERASGGEIIITDALKEILIEMKKTNNEYRKKKKGNFIIANIFVICYLKR